MPPPMVTGDPAAPQVPPTPLGFVWATLLRSEPEAPVAARPWQAHTPPRRLARSSPREFS